jgi:uncharacterized protein (TIGR02598 family)
MKPLAFSRSLSPRPCRARAGFSLVEVAMAIGLLAFCMVAIIGLMPVAMNISADAMDRNAKARILQTIRADALAADRDTLGLERPFYFDLQGNFLGTSPPSGNPEPSHFAVTVAPSAPTTLPGGQQSSHLQMIRLTILRQPQNARVSGSLHIADYGY